MAVYTAGEQIFLYGGYSKVSLSKFRGTKSVSFSERV